MGGFINSQADAEICEVLNKRFSDEVNANSETYLNELRDFFKTEKLFDILQTTTALLKKGLFPSPNRNSNP